MMLSPAREGTKLIPKGDKGPVLFGRGAGHPAVLTCARGRSAAGRVRYQSGPRRAGECRSFPIAPAGTPLSPFLEL